MTLRQEEILDIIRHYVRTKGFPPSIREIATDLGVSSVSTVHCHLLNLERKGFIRKDPTRRRSIELVKDVDPSHREVVYVPVLYAEDLPSLSECGPLEDDPHAEVIPLGLDFVGQREAFVVLIEGESMRDAAILHGDLVVAHRQSRADDGDIVVAVVNDDITVKRYYRANGMVRLQPENARMKAIVLKDVRILGKVVGVVRRVV